MMRGRSIKTQFTVLVCLLLICCIGLTVTSYHGVRSLLNKKNLGYAMTSSLTYAYSMNDLYLRFINIASLLAANENVRSFLTEPLSEKTVPLVRHLSDVLYSFVATNPDIPDISIVGRESYRSTFYSTQMLHQMWQQMGDRRGIACLGMTSSRLPEANRKPASCLVFGFNMFLDETAEPAGCLLLSVDPARFAASSALDFQQDELSVMHFLGVNRTDLYPFHASPTDTEAVEADILAHPALFDLSSSTPQHVSTDRYDYVCLFMPTSDYYVISAIDKNDTLRDLDGTQTVTMLFLLLFIGLLAVGFLLLLRETVLPIRAFHAHVRTIHQGDRREMHKSLRLTGCREMRELSDEFNGMLEQILSLEEQLVKTVGSLYESDIQRQKAEIAHLRSQINPHFLYNTLESIKGLAGKYNVPQIADIATAIGKISRYSIKGTAAVPLAEEMEIADAYLRIQKMRFGQRFDAIMNVPENCRELLVPKMLLQPLAENAIIHGLENRQEGTLYISARREGNDLLVVVQDDGEGMPAERLREIKRLLEDPARDAQHIGLSNIHHRIRLSYGEGYGLSLESEPKSGTKVTVRLPAASPRKEENGVSGFDRG